MALSDDVIRQRLQLLESYVQHLQGYRAMQMARFRNLLVHVYAHINIERVYDHLQNHLDDFGQFAQHVLQFLARDG
jgi:uncharacterized protein YutE (UPF0331/DUF86 family)